MQRNLAAISLLCSSNNRLQGLEKTPLPGVSVSQSTITKSFQPFHPQEEKPKKKLGLGLTYIIIGYDIVQRLRQDRDAFHWFLDNICTAIVGACYAARVKSLQAPRGWLLRSLEAFSLLCMENYLDMVLGQVKEQEKIKKTL